MYLCRRNAKRMKAAYWYLYKEKDEVEHNAFIIELHFFLTTLRIEFVCFLSTPNF